QNRQRRAKQRRQPTTSVEQPPGGQDDQHVRQQEVAAGKLNVRLDGDTQEQLNGERQALGGAQRQRRAPRRAGRRVHVCQRTGEQAFARQRVDQARRAARPGEHEEQQQEQGDRRGDAGRRRAQ